MLHCNKTSQYCLSHLATSRLHGCNVKCPIAGAFRQSYRQPGLRIGCRNTRSPSRFRLASQKMLPHSLPGPPSDVFVLDFDGVLCDSQEEVSTSAYRAAEGFWPDVFSGAGPEAKSAVLAGLRVTRPVLVDGFESTIMARMLLEDPSSVSQILESWDSIWPPKLEEWGSDAAILRGFYEGYRTGMFLGNKDGWIAGNKLYPGIREALNGCEFPYYVVSVKSAKRLSILLTAFLGTSEFPACSPRLFGSLVPPSQKKVDALRKIMERPIVAKGGAKVHFVDDRLDTLKAIKASPGMADVKLYFASWGYATAEDVNEAKHASWLKSIKLTQFVELLQWGILMGVDDGCEPTEEEVKNSVFEKRRST